MQSPKLQFRPSAYRLLFAILWIQMVVLFAPSAQAEMYRHVGSDGKVTFSDQPSANAEAVALEAEIQVQNQGDGDRASGEPSESVLKAREKRREIQRWADRESKKTARRNGSRNRSRDTSKRTFTPVMPSANGPSSVLPNHRPAARAEARCQSQYGKPCSEVNDWKARATSDCERRNLSKDCDGDDYLRSQRPRTRDQQQAISEKRQKRRDRRDRRDRKMKKELDRLLR